MAFLTLVFSVNASGENLSWVSPEIVAVDFMTGPRSSPYDDEFWAALRIKLAPGWVTYWKSPGPYGFQPKFDWRDSRNLADAEILWPAPHREKLPDLDADTAIYAGDVVLPVKLRAVDREGAVEVKLAMDFGVCSTVCIPEHVVFTTVIKPGEHGARDNARLIEIARLNLPRTDGSYGLTVTAARIRHDGHLTIYVASADAKNLDLFVEGEFANCVTRPSPTQEPAGVAFDFGIRCSKPMPPFLRAVIVSDITSVSALVPVSHSD